MKILKRGDLPVEWYYKNTWQCEACGTQFKVEPGDPVRHWDDQRDGEGAQIACPVCSRTVTIYPKNSYRGIG